MKRSETNPTGGVAATRQQLLNAARAVFEEKGYQATTVGAITTAAETAHGTFYLYFRNKEDVFFKVMEAAVADLEGMATVEFEGVDPRAAVEEGMRGFLSLYTAHGSLWRCAMEGSFISPTVEAAWLTLRRSFYERVEQTLENLRAKGQLRPMDTALAANALGSMVEWSAMNQFVLGGGNPALAHATVDDTVRTLTDLWCHAIFPDAEAGDDPASTAQGVAGSLR